MAKGRIAEDGRAEADGGHAAAHRRSKHRWLNDDRWYDLIVIPDEATSEIYYITRSWWRKSRPAQ